MRSNSFPTCVSGTRNDDEKFQSTIRYPSTAWSLDVQGCYGKRAVSLGPNSAYKNAKSTDQVLSSALKVHGTKQ